MKLPDDELCRIVGRVWVDEYGDTVTTVEILDNERRVSDQLRLETKDLTVDALLDILDAHISGAVIKSKG